MLKNELNKVLHKYYFAKLYTIRGITNDHTVI